MSAEYITNLAGVSIYELIGVAGFFGYLSGFMMLQFRLIDGNSIQYTLLSICSACLVLTSLFEHFNLASAMIQISWIVIGILGLMLRLCRPRDGLNQSMPNNATKDRV